MSTTMTGWNENAQRSHLARQGVPPEPLTEGGVSDTAQATSRTLQLSAAEVEVMLCFALSSPLHYGPVEDTLYEKLRRYLRGLYARNNAPALEPMRDQLQF